MASVPYYKPLDYLSLLEPTGEYWPLIRLFFHEHAALCLCRHDLRLIFPSTAIKVFKTTLLVPRVSLRHFPAASWRSHLQQNQALQKWKRIFLNVTLYKYINFPSSDTLNHSLHKTELKLNNNAPENLCSIKCEWFISSMQGFIAYCDSNLAAPFIQLG